jgi:hypothetical protein
MAAISELRKSGSGQPFFANNEADQADNGESLLDQAKSCPLFPA